MKTKKIIGSLMAALVLMLLPGLSFAQDAASAQASTGFSEQEKLLGIAIFLLSILVFALIALLLSVVALSRLLKKPITAEAGVVTEEKKVEKRSLWARLNDTVPLEREHEVRTDHVYDGIVELDNNLPPWWKAMFYATIVFSVVYLAVYHVFNLAPLQDEEYEIAMAEAQAEIDAYRAATGNTIDETNVELLTDEASLAEGAAIYAANNCGACHGAELQGAIVGPNLVDTYWLHGGDIKDVFKTIKVGVPQKGMISWQTQLSPVQIQQVSSYIISKEGSNPPNAKDPQGEEYVRN